MELNIDQSKDEFKRHVLFIMGQLVPKETKLEAHLERYGRIASFQKQSATEQPLGRYDLEWWDSQRKNLSAILLSRVKVLRQQDLAEWDCDVPEIQGIRRSSDLD
jgi:hypothetical protein